VSDERPCERCGDEVQYLSSQDLCDACVAVEEMGEAHYRVSRQISDALEEFIEEQGLRG